MTTEEKRLQLIKKIVNCDEEGVSKLFEMFEKKCGISGFSREDFIALSAKKAAKLAAETDPSVILLLAEYTSTIVNEIYKEEK